MSTIIMSVCWPLQGMSPAQKAVLISLADNANDEGVCWPSVATISKRTCLSDRAVQKAIKWLESTGVLSVAERNGRSTVFTLTPEAYSPPNKVRGEHSSPTPELNDITPEPSSPTPEPSSPRTVKNLQRTVREPKVNTRAKSKPPAKTTLPDDFEVSDAVRSWAEKNGHLPDLQTHFENFVGVSLAKGYAYASWDQALMNAIRQNWAKVGGDGRPLQAASRQAENDRRGDEFLRLVAQQVAPNHRQPDPMTIDMEPTHAAR